MDRRSASLLLTLLPGAVAGCGLSGLSGLQPERQFEWAIRDATAAAAPVVRIGIVDGRTGRSETRCVFSAELIDALMVEGRIARTAEGYRTAALLALQTPSHSFAFARPESLERLRPDGGAALELDRACALIAGGRSARWSMPEARVVAGPSF